MQRDRTLAGLQCSCHLTRASQGAEAEAGPDARSPRRRSRTKSVTHRTDASTTSNPSTTITATQMRWQSPLQRHHTPIHLHLRLPTTRHRPPSRRLHSSMPPLSLPLLLLLLPLLIVPWFSPTGTHALPLNVTSATEAVAEAAAAALSAAGASVFSKLSSLSLSSSEQRYPGLAPGRTPEDAAAATSARAAMWLRASETAKANDTGPGRRSLAGASNIPTCTGVCCSNKWWPKVPKGRPSMMSQWRTARPANGAKIQIRSITWGTWCRASPSLGGPVLCANKEQPTADRAFTVLRVSATEIRLRSAAGLYVRAAPNQALDMTRDGTLPSTLFTLKFDASFASDTFSTRRGTYITATMDGKLWSYATTVSEWERFELREVVEVPAIRGVNLGGWLVYEKWMDPSVFPSVSSLLDGAVIGLQNMVTKGWIATAKGQGSGVLRCTPQYESFVVYTAAPYSRTYMLKGYGSNKFWTTQPAAHTLVYENSVSPSAWSWEGFRFYTHPRLSSDLVLIQNVRTGRFLAAKPTGALTASLRFTTAQLKSTATWMTSASFKILRVSEVISEWHLSYLLTRNKAARRKQIAKRLLKESDWAYMRLWGINTVRIPVGYWIAQARPDFPFAPGGAVFLDWAFAMGAKYGIRIWISMHGAAGSQNGQHHSGTRDGIAHFGEGTTVARTLAAIQWLMRRYGKRTNWLGIGLLNEPSKGVDLKRTILPYYKAALAIIRRSHPCLMVSMEGNDSPWDVHWEFYREPNVILEWHLYSVFNDTLRPNTPQAEVARMRGYYRDTVTSFQSHGMPLLIGEWSNAMEAPDYTSDQRQKAFNYAQMQTIAQAKAGWFFWSYKLLIPERGWWDFRVAMSKGWLPKAPNSYWF